MPTRPQSAASTRRPLSAIPRRDGGAASGGATPSSTRVPCVSIITPRTEAAERKENDTITTTTSTTTDATPLSVVAAAASTETTTVDDVEVKNKGGGERTEGDYKTAAREETNDKEKGSEEASTNPAGVEHEEVIPHAPDVAPPLLVNEVENQHSGDSLNTGTSDAHHGTRNIDNNGKFEDREQSTAPTKENVVAGTFDDHREDHRDPSSFEEKEARQKQEVATAATKATTSAPVSNTGERQKEQKANDRQTAPPLTKHVHYANKAGGDEDSSRKGVAVAQGPIGSSLILSQSPIKLQREIDHFENPTHRPSTPGKNATSSTSLHHANSNAASTVSEDLNSSSFVHPPCRSPYSFSSSPRTRGGGFNASSSTSSYFGHLSAASAALKNAVTDEYNQNQQQHLKDIQHERRTVFSADPRGGGTIAPGAHVDLKLRISSEAMRANYNAQTRAIRTANRLGASNSRSSGSTLVDKARRLQKDLLMLQGTRAASASAAVPEKGRDRVDIGQDCYGTVHVLRGTTAGGERDDPEAVVEALRKTSLSEFSGGNKYPVGLSGRPSSANVSNKTGPQRPSTPSGQKASMEHSSEQLPRRQPLYTQLSASDTKSGTSSSVAYVSSKSVLAMNGVESAVAARQQSRPQSATLRTTQLDSFDLVGRSNSGMTTIKTSVLSTSTHVGAGSDGSQSEHCGAERGDDTVSSQKSPKSEKKSDSFRRPHASYVAGYMGLGVGLSVEPRVVTDRPVSAYAKAATTPPAKRQTDNKDASSSYYSITQFTEEAAEENEKGKEGGEKNNHVREEANSTTLPSGSSYAAALSLTPSRPTSASPATTSSMYVSSHKKPPHQHQPPHQSVPILGNANRSAANHNAFHENESAEETHTNRADEDTGGSPMFDPRREVIDLARMVVTKSGSHHRVEGFVGAANTEGDKVESRWEGRPHITPSTLEMLGLRDRVRAERRDLSGVNEPIALSSPPRTSVYQPTMPPVEFLHQQRKCKPPTGDGLYALIETGLSRAKGYSTNNPSSSSLRLTNLIMVASAMKSNDDNFGLVDALSRHRGRIDLGEKGRQSFVDHNSAEQGSVRNGGMVVAGDPDEIHTYQPDPHGTSPPRTVSTGGSKFPDGSISMIIGHNSTTMTGSKSSTTTYSTTTSVPASAHGSGSVGFGNRPSMRITRPQTAGPRRPYSASSSKDRGGSISLSSFPPSAIRLNEDTFGNEETSHLNSTTNSNTNALNATQRSDNNRALNKPFSLNGTQSSERGSNLSLELSISGVNLNSSTGGGKQSLHAQTRPSSATSSLRARDTPSRTTATPRQTPRSVEESMAFLEETMRLRQQEKERIKLVEEEGKKEQQEESREQGKREEISNEIFVENNNGEVLTSDRSRKNIILGNVSVASTSRSLPIHEKSHPQPPTVSTITFGSPMLYSSTDNFSSSSSPAKVVIPAPLVHHSGSRPLPSTQQRPNSATLSSRMNSSSASSVARRPQSAGVSRKETKSGDASSGPVRGSHILTPNQSSIYSANNAGASVIVKGNGGVLVTGSLQHQQPQQEVRMGAGFVLYGENKRL